MLSVKLISGPQKGREYRIVESVGAVLGRKCKDVLIPDMMASRQHAQMIFQNGGWIINDLDSSNGTYINGIRIDHFAELEVGDVIRIGETDLKVVAIDDCVDEILSPTSLTPRTEQPADPSQTKPSQGDSSRSAFPQPMTKDEVVEQQLMRNREQARNYVKPHVHVSPRPASSDSQGDLSEEAMNEQTIAGTVYDPTQVIEAWDEQETDEASADEALLQAQLNEADQMALEINELLQPFDGQDAIANPSDTDSKRGAGRRIITSLAVLSMLGGLGFLAYENYHLKKQIKPESLPAIEKAVLPEQEVVEVIEPEVVADVASSSTVAAPAVDELQVAEDTEATVKEVETEVAANTKIAVPEEATTESEAAETSTVADGVQVAEDSSETAEQDIKLAAKQDEAVPSDEQDAEETAIAEEQAAGDEASAIDAVDDTQTDVSTDEQPEASPKDKGGNAASDEPQTPAEESADKSQGETKESVETEPEKNTDQIQKQ